MGHLKEQQVLLTTDPSPQVQLIFKTGSHCAFLIDLEFARLALNSLSLAPGAEIEDV